MADIPSIPPLPGAPTGAEPMKKSTGKVQPKKETVRINLPPKPTAAPTIKLPTLPPGGPTGASSGMPMPASTGAPRTAAAPVAAQRPSAAPARGAAPVAAQRPSAIAPAPVAKISIFDKILAIAACLAALAAIGTTIWMMMILNEALNQ
jgi:hypothetical protein